jgi:bifunctional non-homologous end joining protein LigD
VLRSISFDAKPAELIRAARELKLEGVIAKRKGSLYEPGKRSGAWLKYKTHKSQEFVIGGYTLGGNPFDALIVGCYEGSKLNYVAKVRAGLYRTCVAPCSRSCRSYGQRNVHLMIYLRSGERFIRSQETRCKTPNG